MENYKELQEYLGLESEEDAKLFEYLDYEFSQMGAWGTKIITYLKAILSRNKRYKTYVQDSDVELYRKLLKDSMTILDMELKRQKNNDNI